MFFFSLHSGHLKAKADKIAKKHGARHINYTDANGTLRGWFSCPNRGSPFDTNCAAAVMADITAAGGLDTLMKKPGRSRSDYWSVDS